MPSLVRKLIIIAAAEGLLLHPQHPRGQKTLQFEYGGSGSLSPYQKEPPNLKEATSLEAHGVVGLLTVAQSSFLIGITGRKQVAQFRGRPIYVITGVALIPLSSQTEARNAIENAQKKENLPEDDETDSSDDEYTPASKDDVQTPAHELESTISNDSHEMRPRKDSTIAEDVISRKGLYGRFADRWFSRSGWRKDTRRVQAVSDDAEETTAAEGRWEGEADGEQDSRAPETNESSKPSSMPLLPKLLRTTKMLFGSRSFYFSYDMDITRRLGTQEPESDLPLHKVVDASFFWNQHLLSPFTDNSRGFPFALPIMQGFVGQKAFTVNLNSQSIAYVKEDMGEVIEMQDNASISTNFRPSPTTKDFLITLVSRRSVKRPGLRYLRRGIDEDGNVANYVETEQILSEPSWNISTPVYSFTQIRGSIPLYFSQSPYSLKPVPVLHHSEEMNATAFRKHISKVIRDYGGVQIACLVDKHGTEHKVGQAFENNAKSFNEQAGAQQIHWNWFDFHTACRGMKFENVSILLDEISATMQNYGVTIERDGEIQRRQKGVLRVNCMDCLDRTNVVESATAQRALEMQLSTEGIELDMQADPSTSWFNMLWADNGDAISKQYSGTAALKGDFTRTRKRDYRGALNDFGLTLTRFYSNIVNDFFSQASIDFLIGNVGDDIFDEFEQKMTTADPAELVSMKRIRQTAIDNSFKIVIADESEDLISGWTLLSPRTPNSVRTAAEGLEEIVLLLTNAALYAVRFDWTTEKVASFERIALRNIKSITRGTYISSVFTSSQCDPKKNFGFAIRFKPGSEDEKKFNTRSMSTTATPTLGSLEWASQHNEPHGERQQKAMEQAGARDQAYDASLGQSQIEEQTPADMHILALKALPSKAPGEVQVSGTTTSVMNEMETIESISDDVARLARVAVDKGDIVSLAEAKRTTGMLEQIGHRVKMLVWGT